MDILFKPVIMKDTDAELVWPYYIASVKLTRIAKQMMLELYQERLSFSTEPPTPEVISLSAVYRHYRILHEWYRNLPLVFQHDEMKEYTVASYGLLNLRSLVSINLFYHSLVVLLYRKLVVTIPWGADDNSDSRSTETPAKLALTMCLRSALTITHITGLCYEHELCDGYSFHVGIHYTSFLYSFLAQNCPSSWSRRLLRQNIRNFEESQSYRLDLKNTRQYLYELKNDLGWEKDVGEGEGEGEEVRGAKFDDVFGGVLEELLEDVGYGG